jgi:pyruvate dehydrogenase complex dehydrogenase (E1) component
MYIIKYFNPKVVYIVAEEVRSTQLNILVKKIALYEKIKRHLN